MLTRRLLFCCLLLCAGLALSISSSLAAANTQRKTRNRTVRNGLLLRPGALQEFANKGIGQSDHGRGTTLGSKLAPAKSKRGLL